MGRQVMWMLRVWVVVERGGTGVSVLPTHPLGHGACITGCRTLFDACMGPARVLVGAGTCLGATTDGGGAAALQQQ